MSSADVCLLRVTLRNHVCLLNTEFSPVGHRAHWDSCAVTTSSLHLHGLGVYVPGGAEETIAAEQAVASELLTPFTSRAQCGDWKHRLRAIWWVWILALHLQSPWPWADYLTCVCLNLLLLKGNNSSVVIGLLWRLNDAGLSEYLEWYPHVIIILKLSVWETIIIQVAYTI